MTEPIKPATDEEIAGWTPDRNTPEALFARIQSDAAKLKALELERDTIQEYADQVGANLTAAEGTLAERDARIAELEQIMTLHFITLDDDHRPEGKQGWEKERAFRDECCRIIQRQAKEASRGRE